MAKQCQACKKSYPDDRVACPHCGTDPGHVPLRDDIAIDWEALDEHQGAAPPAATPSGSDVVRLADLEEPTLTGSDVVQILHPDSGPDIMMNVAPPGADPGDSSIVTLSSEAGGSKVGSDVFLEMDPVPGEGTVHPPADAGPAMSGTVAAFTPLPEPPAKEVADQRRAGNRPATMIDTGAETAEPPAMGWQDLAELEQATPSRLDIPSPAHSDLISGVEIHDEALHGGPSSGTLARAFLEEESEAAATGPEAHDEVLAEAPVDEEAPAEIADMDEAQMVADEEPVGPPGRGRGARAWVGGGVLGLVLGLMASFGLWMAGIEPPAGWRKGKAPLAPTAPAVAQAPPPAAGTPAPVPAGPGSAPAVSPLDLAAQHMGRGELEKAVGVLAKVEKPSPEELARRGEARWLNYLSHKRHERGQVSATDPEVAGARKDLSESKAALGLFWLGQMDETLGKIPEARQTYERGLKEYPDQKSRFQAALDRLDALTPEMEGAAGNSQSRASAVALLCIALQEAPATGKATGTAPPAAPKIEAPGTKLPAATGAIADEEAGFAFWKAVRLARGRQYEGAIKVLKQAKEVHDQRRYVRLNQGQNPISDPTEQIFLRSCDEMIQLWQLKAQLVAAGLPTRPADLVKAARPAAAKPSAESEALVERLRQEKLLPAGDSDVAKAVERLLGERKKTEDQLAAVRSALAEAKVEGEADIAGAVKKLAGERQTSTFALAGIREVLKSVGAGDEENVARAVEKLADAKKSAEAQAKEVAGKLETDEAALDDVARRLTEAHYLDAASGRAGLAKAVDRALTDSSAPVVTALARLAGDLGGTGSAVARQLAGAVDLAGRLSDTKLRLARAQAQLLQARAPRQMLDIWAELLRDPRNGAQAAAALADAQRVAEDTGAEPAARAEALAVQGLALRCEGKLSEARKLLDQAVTEAGSTPAGGWLATARDTLRELSDPEAYFLPEAARLAAAGQPQPALAVLDRALETFSAGSREAGRVLAARAVLRLDLARAAGTGTLTQRDPQVAQARGDAEAALADGATADGEYAVGSLAEALGNGAGAERSYRKALAAHPEPDAAGNRYRLALARALIRQSARPAAAPAGDRPEEGKSGRGPAEQDDGRTIRVSARAEATALTASARDLDQAIELASQAIHAGDARGYFVKAEALGRQERWSEALSEYVTGLSKLMPAGYVSGLRELMENHPGLRMPAPLSRPQPLAAERHFETGARLYWAGRYTAAEDDFALAVRGNPEDARYYYFLGLARLQQGRRADAYEAFRQGGQREALGKPSNVEVGAILERVQGPDRKLLDREAHRGG